jgi:hypothetical protein
MKESSLVRTAAGSAGLNLVPNGQVSEGKCHNSNFRSFAAPAAQARFCRPSRPNPRTGKTNGKNVPAPPGPPLTKVWVNSA